MPGNNSYKEKIDGYLNQAQAAQPALLKSMLAVDVPIRYEDEQGRYVQENPDGTVEILSEDSEK